jgi:hypothetical protein
MEGISMSAPAPAAPTAPWSIADLEPAIAELRDNLGIMGHLIDSPHAVEADQWRRIEDRLNDAADQINELWRRAWDERCAMMEAHEAALAAAKATKAAPGSVADVENARAYWSMLHVIASQAATACQKAEAAAGKSRRVVRPAPKRGRQRRS